MDISKHPFTYTSRGVKSTCVIGLALCLSLFGLLRQIPPTGWLGSSRTVFLPFWRLEVRDQDASLTLPWLRPGKGSSAGCRLLSSHRVLIQWKEQELPLGRLS